MTPGRNARPHRLRRPIFVVGAPCSGAEQVARILSACPGAVGLRVGHGERPLGAAPRLRPAERGWDSERLVAQDARPEPVLQLEAAWQVPDDGRLVASWPAAALQVRFLHAAWPDATFVLVHRDPAEAIAAGVAAWESPGADRATPPTWDGPAWTGPLTPEWRLLAGRPVEEVATDQWRRATDHVLTDLERLPAAAWTVASAQEMSARPDALSILAGSLGLEIGPTRLDLPSAPPPARERVKAVIPTIPTIAVTAQRVRDVLDRPRADLPGAPAATYSSAATPNFPELLKRLGSSLVATTYQTGRVVLMREQQGELNTHFRAFPKPMGIAHRPGVLALGTRTEVLTFRDVPGLVDRVGAEHDAVFVPRSTLQTGDIRIHDVAWVGAELWAVNTRFSCLSTFDGVHSFVPRWKPPFISALAPEDRCHLNGLAVVDDRVRYVTALGTTDTAGAWRASKADGGVIMDVTTDEVVVSGLSMPHSPRWYRGSLWVLESGQGTLAKVDLDAGTWTTVAELPGFTRGLAFAGRYAFVGLSQVREATTFGGIPLTARLEDRQCGVWIVDIETGQTMGFVRFEDRVQEIFDVALLPGLRFPELLEPGDDVLTNAFLLPRG